MIFSGWPRSTCCKQLFGVIPPWFDKRSLSLDASHSLVLFLAQADDYNALQRLSALSGLKSGSLSSRSIINIGSPGHGGGGLSGQFEALKRTLRSLL